TIARTSRRAAQRTLAVPTVRAATRLCPKTRSRREMGAVRPGRAPEAAAALEDRAMVARLSAREARVVDQRAGLVRAEAALRRPGEPRAGRSERAVRASRPEPAGPGKAVRAIHLRD